ncbi:MAG: ATP-binding protein [Lachnospiraceae bacterium]|nr:ATP-binding protein [Lachnospiraceae bacterium]
MFIKEMWYQELNSGFVIDHVGFGHRKTLLVGNSGAGKTRILEAVNTVCKLAVGTKKNIPNPFKAELKFSAENRDCCWQVKVDYVPQINVNEEESNAVIKEERLTVNGDVVIEKSGDKFKLLNYGVLPQPKENESLISQYRNEEQIGQIYEEFQKVYLRMFEIDMRGSMSPELYEAICGFYKKSYISLIQNIPIIAMSPFDQYGILKNVDSEAYQKMCQEILEFYQEIFPEVEEISYLLDESKQYRIAIRVNNNWILQKDISSGMLKTLWIIIKMKMIPGNAVVLIDELENGLGVNCIEIVSDFIINSRPDVQVLATSHHPYIINAIPMDNWMIVQRKEQVVKAYRSDEMALGRSRHDAYLQLVNRLQYE